MLKFGHEIVNDIWTEESLRFDSWFFNIYNGYTMAFNVNQP